ncbi:MAG TPA: diguanylate cyclase [Rhodoferax sp.]|jgi:diguanylate cyclase (GGDEF)-like protein|nr:diguanylate cyclase [Rhodoferax sp.]HNV59383.1 diguanylate cyclase [Rhodoferax sp.]HPW28426.1 diguanylate cyclase [Rhodoferax sp.]
MSAEAITGGIASGVPVWLDWVLSNTPSGLVLLDAQARVVFANKWFLSRAKVRLLDMSGHDVLDVFPVLRGGHFERVLHRAIRSGFPALLSQTLHPSPFPLYAPNGGRGNESLLKQSIHIVPMGPSDTAEAGQRFTLIQISDVSPTVARERLLKAQADRMSGLVNVDALTGIGNRRFFDESMVAEVRAASRGGSSLGLLMLDVDQFKQFNDLYGHPAGDACLKAVAGVLRSVCRRPRDLVARYGGEELVAILPDTDEVGSIRVAREVLQKTRDLGIEHTGNFGRGVVTLSAGVCVGSAHTQDSPASLISRADQALYAAKNAGRDRVFCFDISRQVAVPV